MSLVGEGLLDTPILAATVDSIPGAELQLETIRALSDERIRFLVWVAEADRTGFEAGVTTDETVESFRLLTGTGDRRLYRVALSETGREFSTYPAAAEADIVVIDLRVTAEGVRFLGRFPSRDALRDYAKTCEQHGVGFRLDRLYEEDAGASDVGSGLQFGLTRPQRRALRCALEMGYFEVPRETSVSAVADELGTSVQATSTILRRGEKRLLKHTVGERELLKS